MSTKPNSSSKYTDFYTVEWLKIHFNNFRQARDYFQIGTNSYKKLADKLNTIIKPLNEEIKLNPDVYESWYYRGKTLSEIHLHEEAINSFETALDLNSEIDDLYRFWFNCGQNLYEKNQYEGAILFFNKAFKSNPNAENGYNFWHKLGQELYKNKEYEGAILFFDQGFTIKPDIDENYKFWNQLGEQLSAQGEDKKAILFFNKAIALKADDAQVLYNKGYALLEEGLWEEAMSLFEESFNLSKDADTFSNMCCEIGTIFSQDCEYEEAIPYFKKAIEVNPNNYRIWAELVDSLFLHHIETQDINYLEEAMDAVDKVIELKPKINQNTLFSKLYEELLYSVSCCDFEIDNDFIFSTEHHLRILNKIMEINPNDAQVWYHKGYNLYRLGRYEESLHCYDKVIDIYDDYNNFFWYERGLLLTCLGRNIEALFCFNKSLRPCRYSYVPEEEKTKLLDIIKAKAAQFSCQELTDEDKSFLEKGLNLLESEQFEAAIDYFNQGINNNPNVYLFWYYQGVALDNLGQKEEAIASFDQALEIHPYDYDTWYYRGNILSKLGKSIEAQTSYDMANTVK
ncbi:MAG: tetratricopeptide repeat protein [Crocosphaera sp.]